MPSSRWSGTMTATARRRRRRPRRAIGPAGDRHGRRRSGQAPEWPTPGRRRPMRRANRDRRPHRSPWSRGPGDDLGSLVTIAPDGRPPRRPHIRPSTEPGLHDPAPESTAASRALPKVNDRSGTTIPASSWDRLGIRCVCYRPWTRCIPPRRRCSGPGCASACAGRSKVSRTSRRTARRSSRAITSRISTRSPWPGWPIGANAASASSPRRSCSRTRPRRVAARRAPDSGVPRHGRFLGCALGRGRSAAQGRMRRGVPGRHDLRGSRTDARQVGNGPARAGIRSPGRPRRSLGHAPADDEGPQAALEMGDRAGRGRRHARAHRRGCSPARGDAAGHGCDHGPAWRELAIYPEHPRSDDDTWWWRDPETADAHRRPA